MRLSAMRMDLGLDDSLSYLSSFFLLSILFDLLCRILAHTPKPPIDTSESLKQAV